MATAASTSPAANAASNLPRKADIRALGAVSSMMSSRWKLSRLLPEGSAESKSARVSRRGQAEMPRLPAAVQGVHGGGGLPIAVQPPSPTGIGAFRPHSTTPARGDCKENQGKPRKKAWISLHSLGLMGTFQWVMAKK